MRVLISGASGLLGSAVAGALRGAGWSVDRLARPGSNNADAGRGVRWDPVTGQIDRGAAEGSDAVVHLAGESIASGRWNEARKKALRTSRVEATRGLVTGLLTLDRRPKVLVCASAVGIFGNRGDEELTEESAPGDDFLGKLARDWEKEAARAADFGIRTVMLRFGVILAPHGGALPRMLFPFQMGVGGRLGSGRQWMSWLTLPDAVWMVRFALENEQLSGPVNAVAPNPVRNSEFTAVLGKVLKRPTIFPAPAFILRLALGEMADALLLSSQRAIPLKLQAHQYGFKHPELEGGLRLVLGR